MAKKMIDEGLLELVQGGALGFNPDDQGTYTMECQFSGESYGNVPLGIAIEIAKYGAMIPNTPEGEKQIIDWAKGKNYIH